MDPNSMSPEAWQAFLDMPAMKSPEGHIPQFDNPPNKNHVAHIAVTICLVAACVGMLGRMIARRKLLHAADYVGLVSFGFYIATTYFLYSLIHSPGFFVHQYDMRLRTMVTFNKRIFIITHLYIGCVVLIKVAIILEWLRIFSANVRDWYYWVSHFILWTNVLHAVISIILVNTSALPYRAIWDPTIRRTEVRLNTAQTNLAGACLNIIYDVLLLVLPQQKIWSLHIQTHKKIGISIVFAFGLIALAAAAARLDATVIRKKNPDYTYSYSRLGLWTYAELTCGILIFSIPALPKVVEQMKPGLIVSTIRSWGSTSIRWLFRSRTSKSSSAESQNSSSHPREYHKVEEPELPLVQMDSTKNGEFRDKTTHVSDSDVEAGIVRTTDFTAFERYPVNEPSDVHQSQHPWMRSKN